MGHPGNSEPALELTGVTKVFGGHETAVRALDGVDLTLPSGRFLAVMGPSGSGKSTLLNCAAGLDEPTSGTVRLQGRTLSDMSEGELTRFRRTHLGFVFQHFNLLPYLTAQENVELPFRLAGARVDKAAVAAALESVGLSQREGHLPAELSGGQQQRVAVARALVNRPAVLFADEPTGALESSAARSLLVLLRQAGDRGQTIVMVTHDPVAASYADEVVFLADGRIVGMMAHPTAAAVAEQLARTHDLAQVSR